MGQKSYGIVSAGDGSFLCTGVEKTSSGWRVKSTSCWNADSRRSNALLLHRGVVAAAPCRWIRSNDAFVPDAGEAALSAYTDRLADNLLAIVPEDAYLCTIPLALDGGLQSFVAVHRDGRVYKIGIITSGRALAAVFTMAPATPQAFEGHLGRIERYWKDKCGGVPFPARLVVFGEDTGFFEEATLLDCRPLGIDVSDTAALAAAGAALADEGCGCGSAPRFPVNTDKAAFRVMRTALYAASAAMVLCAVLLFGAVWTSSALSRRQLDKYTREYRRVLANTPRIAQLSAQNDSLARAVLSAYSAGSRQTQWAPFLQFLGEDRPEGLFFDMLASDAGAAGKVRIALSGWAENESLVTGFISLLQKNKACSEVSLSSLEKSNDSHNIFQFRIQCSLQLFAGSPEK
jgi:Tfp pilus assembly protein PilN